jgi:hypothetical protein
MDDDSITGSSASSCSSYSPATPASTLFGGRRQTANAKPTRLDPAPDEVDPVSLVGKTLVQVRRSPSHPSITLHFSDGSSYQIRVDGYNPQFPGLSKVLEMNAQSHGIFPESGGHANVHLTVDRCASIRMRDKAFDARSSKETTWEQAHLGIVLKFKERDGWHCLWAMLADNDNSTGLCVFRSFEDVYIAQSPARPFNKGHNKRRSRQERQHRV